ncbi:hypothetical protein CcI49_12345 [Frankia sp. CcI49]|uniref:hypothetical protein n=1 Tax=unclassified Frankia TaxID=2632575 RepID=UPI0006C9F763|nr:MULTISPECIES: hypothetical protein [unclassified Frankia]KPM57084.1 hypothetical protein ACG83_04685 [Frankia sp. R43]ONH60180.1 hypothetical protein CcI49_12345 [Frankia sp. CcI49]
MAASWTQTDPDPSCFRTSITFVNSGDRGTAGGSLVIYVNWLDQIKVTKATDSVTAQIPPVGRGETVRMDYRFCLQGRPADTYAAATQWNYAIYE